MNTAYIEFPNNFPYPFSHITKGSREVLAVEDWSLVVGTDEDGPTVVPYEEVAHVMGSDSEVLWGEIWWLLAVLPSVLYSTKACRFCCV